MHFDGEQLQAILNLKEILIEKLEKNKKESILLEKNLRVMDIILGEMSFVKASSLKPSSTVSNYPISIKKNNKENVIANASITNNQISIELNRDINLSEEIPPLKSFFINRIIAEMRDCDLLDVKKGIIDSKCIISYHINKNDNVIRNIIIKNYRRKERINEIINTITWSLSRMVENSE